MNPYTVGLGLMLAMGLGGCAMSPEAGEHGHHAHMAAAPAEAAPPMHAPGAMADTRQFVPYPEHLRVHTLANMRDHLVTLGEIQAALATGAFDQASDLAEQRLGMSSLAMHGAHDVAPFMPAGMQAAGTAMHRSASQFALVAKNVSVTGDVRPALAALATLNRTCVACHAAYRLH